MALIKCDDCGRDVSDRAPACPNCGAPIAGVTNTAPAPRAVTLEGEAFIGTRPLLVQLAIRAVQSLNYKVDAADEASGLVGFTTGMTWGSWSGVSGSISFDEIAPHTFQATGRGKQNLRGGQFVALNLFDEANGKVRKVVEEMRRLATQA